MVRKTEPISAQLKWAHLYLNALEGESSFKQHRETYRKQLLPFLQSLEPDEDGNFYYEFPDPITVGDDSNKYKGLMAQRRVSEYVNEEKARELIYASGKDVELRCFKEVRTIVIDYDELYACNQEGLITDDEIDTILEVAESYALVKVKA